MRRVQIAQALAAGPCLRLRLEYRRDWSGLPFFLTAEPGKLKREQDTATLGLIWWIGGKEGPW
jgi:hypothetical protein